VCAPATVTIVREGSGTGEGRALTPGAAQRRFSLATPSAICRSKSSGGPVPKLLAIDAASVLYEYRPAVGSKLRMATIRVNSAFASTTSGVFCFVWRDSTGPWVC
jgi:hypothetical protein